jgi:cellulose synthase/poly-beta-1,6-N-acetylglucosamine synthase-like glycosyltransferase
MRIFIRQRIRWARGLVQLYLHREVLLIKNMAKQVYLFFLITYYEFAVPILEALGLLALLISISFMTLTSII